MILKDLILRGEVKIEVGGMYLGRFVTCGSWYDFFFEPADGSEPIFSSEHARQVYKEVDRVRK